MRKIDKKEFKRLVEAGLTDAKIAERLGVQRAACGAARKRWGIRGSRETAERYMRPAAEEWQARLLNNRQLGELLGINAHRAASVRRTQGLPSPRCRSDLALRAKARAALSLYRRGWEMADIWHAIWGTDAKMPAQNACTTMARYLEAWGEAWPERAPTPIGRVSKRPEMDRWLFSGVDA